ncbi:MAG TPA: hypothetical protein VKT53_15175 [Candidatus Acidoferrum sp.]|nr:hypothetical protein [Candidatus Acidoferrum sp.]
MKLRIALPITLGFLLAVPAFAQRPEDRKEERHDDHRDGPRANQGRIPQAPPPQRERNARPEEERHDKRVNSTPHVTNDHWYGHDRPNDRRYVVSHPFEHGHFEHIGPSYRYRVERFDRDRHRFWFPGGFYFQVADWDWDLAADWCWDCGDDFTVYDDPDHPGWYLVYNIHTGGYVHATYMGS